MVQTLALIKPDAVERGLVGRVAGCAEEAGLKIVRARMVHLTGDEAREFYRVHAERPFFNDLVTYMTRSPIVAMVLEGDDAVNTWRRTMGATDPKRAEPGTVRARYGRSVQENSVHGSDSPENARIEIAFFDLRLALRG